MRRVYSSSDIADVALHRSILEGANIPCEMRNEAVSQVLVGFQFAPEIWVQDEDYENAIRLLKDSFDSSV